MQIDTSHTDTLKHDSIVLPLLPDTIIPDTTPLKEDDSLPEIEKKDSISPPGEKKTGIKITPADSVIKSSFPTTLVVSDTLPEGISPDSLPDSSLSVQLQKADTAFTFSVPAKGEEELLKPHLRNTENNSWVVILFLTAFTILVWAKVSYSKRIRQFFEAFLSNRYIRQMVREEFVFSHPSSIALSVVFLLTAALLLTQANSYFHWNLFLNGLPPAEATRIGVFFKFLFSLTLFYIGKIVVIRLSAALFAAGEEITEYLFNLFLFNNILGILLLPLAIAVVFANAISPQKILIFSGILVFLAFIFRIVKCFYIGSITTKFSKSYIILYICTLEILPLIVVIKAFSGSL